MYKRLNDFNKWLLHLPFNQPLKGEEISDEMTDLVAETLKSGEEGAYDLNYGRLGFNIEHIKLPTLNGTAPRKLG